MKKFRLIGFSLMIATLILSACDGGSENEAGEEVRTTGKTVFVLFDVSDSTKAEETRRKYRESFEKIVEKLGPNDVIVADFISDDPLGQASFAINEEFPKFNATTDNELILKKEKGKFEEELKALRAKVAENGRKFLDGEKGAVLKTKLFDANLLAEKVFKKYDRPKKVLVIFSDMAESSSRADFEKEKVTKEVGARIIDKLEKAGKIPDLSGVRVYVIGAAGSFGEDSFTLIQNFWIDYYEKTEAELNEENYGSALLGFDE